jgi:putative methyltransferase (TIGR04325 family)
MSENYLWRGPYLSWGEAEEAISIEGVREANFESSQWISRIISQLQSYRNETQQYGNALPPRPCNLPMIHSIIGSKKIIDYGGSSGWAWEYLKNSIPNPQVESYTVIELTEIANRLRAYGLHQDKVFNYKTIDSEFEYCDLLYANSILQYQKDNSELVKLIHKTNPSYIFLEDVYCVDNREFFGLQKYYGEEFITRFSDFKKISEDLNKFGYELILKCPYSSPINGVHSHLPMENFPSDFRLRFSTSTLYRRVV